MPAECPVSARRGRAADLRVIFTKYSINFHNNIDITVSLHFYHFAFHHGSEENSGR